MKKIIMNFSCILLLVIMGAFGANSQNVRSCAAPQNLETSVTNSSVTLAWETPQEIPAEDPVWLQYHDDSYLGGMTAGSGVNEIIYAARWTAEDLQNMNLDGYVLSKIKFHPTTSLSYWRCYMSAWVGGTDVAPGTQVVDQLALGYVLTEWKEVELTNPITIDASQGLWIGVRCVRAGSSGNPISISGSLAVDGVGNMIYKNGQWMKGTDANPAFIYNFCVSGYLEAIDGGKTVQLGNRMAKETTLTGYKIYRDGEFQEMVTSTSFTQNNVPNGAYEYCVTAVYSDDCESNEICSNATVDVPVCNPPTALVPTVTESTVALAWTAPAEGTPTGYKVFRNDELQGTVTTTTFSQENVANGTYSYCVKAIYTSCESDEVCIDNVVVDVPVSTCAAPQNLETSVTNNSVTLTWEAPTTPPPANQWIEYHNGNPVGGVSGGGNYNTAYMACRWTPEDLTSMDGFQLSRVKFYNNVNSAYTRCAYYIQVWQGGSATDPGTLVYNGAREAVLAAGWYDLALSTPVVIDTDKELWIGIKCVKSNSCNPLSLDNGVCVEGKSNLVNVNGTWTTLTQYLGASNTQNWLISGYVEAIDGGKTVQLGNRIAKETTLTGYKIYRDGEFQEMVTSTSFTQNNVPNGAYEYCVTAVYSDDCESNEICSNAMVDVPVCNPPTALVPTVTESTVALAWTAPAEGTPTGYKIFRDDVLQGTVTTTTFSQENVANGTYSYCVKAIYTSCESDEVCIDNVVVDVPVSTCAAPQNLETSVTNNSVTLTWEAPTTPPPANQWIEYHNGNPVGGVSGGGNYNTAYMACRWTPEDLTSMDGFQLSRVKFYNNVNSAYTRCAYYIQVWQGGSATDPGTLVYNGAREAVLAAGWYDLALSTPVVIDTDKELWIGIKCVKSNSCNPLSLDNGVCVEGKSNLVNVNGTWTTLTQYLGASNTQNWLISGYVEAIDGGKTVQLGNRMAKETTLTGYKIYRDGEFQEMVTSTSFTQNNVPNGAYEYCVTAVYSDDCESNEICSNAMVDVPVCNPPTALVPTVTESTVALAWTAPAEGTPTGYKIFRDDVLQGTVTTTTFSQENVANGTYSYCVKAIHTSCESDEVCIDNVVVDVPVSTCAAPQNLETSVTNNSVTLTWEAPTTPPPANQWIEYHNGNPVGGVSGGGNYNTAYMACRWTPEDLTSMDGFQLSRVKFYNNVNSAYTRCAYYIQVWQGGSATDPGTLVYNGAREAVLAAGWYDLALSTPVVIDTDKELWIGIKCVKSNSCNPLSLDNGVCVEGKSNLVNVNGTWTTLTQYLGASNTQNWLISGYVEAIDGGKTVQLGNRMAKETTLTGYKIYRDGEFQEMVTSTSFTQNNVPNGAYEYCVTAVYSDDCESNEICSNAMVDVPVCNPPTALVPTVTESTVALAWTAPAEGTPTGYKIFRDDVLQGTVTTTTFSQENVANGTYNYCAKAVYEACESEEICISVEVDVPPTTYIITATAGENGSIDPEGEITVIEGSNQTFTFTADNGYEVDQLLVDNVNVADSIAGGSYTFKNVTEDHIIAVTFKLIPIPTYTITATAGSNGSITPNGEITVIEGSNQTFTFTADNGYEVDQLLVDNVNVADSIAGGSYTFKNVTEDHIIAVTFKLIPIPTYTITATAGSNGSITPNGEITVIEGSNQTFTFTADNGYEVDQLLVDNINIADSIAGGSYTFKNVTEDHIIAVTFKLIPIPTYTISATAGENGSIDPTGNVVVNHGDDQTFTITPNEGYKIAQVLVDGVNNTEAVASGSYTFTDVTAAHTIEATFEQRTYIITATAGKNGSIDPMGIISVAYGDNKTFVITPDEEYQITQVLIDGVNNAAAVTSGSYTFNNITGNHTIEARFKHVDVQTATINVSYGAGGKVSPNGLITVSAGENKTFTIMPNNGYKINQVLIDGVNDEEAVATGTYTFENVTEDHSLVATFTYISGEQYFITASSGTTGGVISPNGKVTVMTGDDYMFTITPNAGYKIKEVLVDGVNNPTAVEAGFYIFENITASHTIVAKYEKQSFTIMASVDGIGGTITPAGATTITYNGSKAYNIASQTGYMISEVLIDGVNDEKAVSSGKYTFSNVTENHTIVVSFKPRTYEITATAGDGGTIAPEGISTITYGNSVTYDIVADAGYKIKTVMVDGKNNSAAVNSGVYTFSNVTAKHTIAVTFTAISNAPMAIGDDNQEITLKVYPNPTVGALKIESGKLNMNDVKVFDITGRLVLEVNNVDNNKTEIDLSNYADGVYFIRVDGKTTKVVKR